MVYTESGLEMQCVCCGKEYVVNSMDELHPNYDINKSLIGWHCTKCWNKIKNVK